MDNRLEELFRPIMEELFNYEKINNRKKDIIEALQKEDYGEMLFLGVRRDGKLRQIEYLRPTTLMRAISAVYKQKGADTKLLERLEKILAEVLISCASKKVKELLGGIDF